MDPRFKKYGAEQADAEQALAIFQNELVNLSVIGNPVNLNPTTHIKTQNTLFYFWMIDLLANTQDTIRKWLS